MHGSSLTAVVSGIGCYTPRVNLRLSSGGGKRKGGKNVGRRGVKRSAQEFYLNLEALAGGMGTMATGNRTLRRTSLVSIYTINQSADDLIPT